MARPIFFTLPALALILSASPARAQINIEALRGDLVVRPLFLALQASFSGHVGNTNGAVGSASAFAGMTRGNNLVFLKLQGDYAEFSGTSTISKAFAHARYNYRFTTALSGEAFVQVEEDKFQRLALRQVDGLGVRFSLLPRSDVEMYFGSAWMLDYERLNETKGPLDSIPGARWFAQRWSNYLSLSWRLTPKSRISEVFYVQPRFNDFYDVRVLNDASFVIDIDKRLSVKIDSQVHYNSTPPSRVLSTDVDTITSLVLTL